MVVKLFGCRVFVYYVLRGYTREHDKYTDQARYQREVKAGDTNQDTATYNPFADLKSMLKK